MKKLLFYAAMALFLFSSCESGDIVGGRYFGTFKNTSNNMMADGSLGLQYGILIHYNVTDSISYSIDSTLERIDTILDIDSLTIPGFYDTLHIEYQEIYSYDTNVNHTSILSSPDTLRNQFLLNKLVPMSDLNDNTFTCTVINPDTLSLLIKSIPALYNLKLCDSTEILDKVVKQLEVNAEFKGSSVQSTFIFTFLDENTTKVEFFGNDH